MTFNNNNQNENTNSTTISTTNSETISYTSSDSATFVGMQYIRPRHRFSKKDEVTFVLDDFNRYDSNAIKVIVDGNHVAFVAREDCLTIRANLAICSKYSCALRDTWGQSVTYWITYTKEKTIQKPVSPIKEELKIDYVSDSDDTCNGCGYRDLQCRCGGIPMMWGDDDDYY